MSARFIQPLRNEVAIVDANGRPTPDFMRLWQDSLANVAAIDRSVQQVGTGGTGTGGSTGGIEASAVVPLVDGVEPPAFITDAAGNLIFVPWGP
jgi:hypothetical protein